MFARISIGASKFNGHEQFRYSDRFCQVDEDLSVDLSVLASLFTPNTEQSLKQVRGLYERLGALSPIFGAIHDVLTNDFALLQSLFPTFNDFERGGNPSIDETSSSDDAPSSGTLGETLGSYCLPREYDPLSVTNPVPLPKIVITTHGDDEDNTSFFLPFQDSCFGDRLTVPERRTWNSTHPPMLNRGPSVPACTRWLWNEKRGHWQAIMPTALDPKVCSRIQIPSRKPKKAKRRILHRFTITTN